MRKEILFATMLLALAATLVGCGPKEGEELEPAPAATADAQKAAGSRLQMDNSDSAPAGGGSSSAAQGDSQ